MPPVSKPTKKARRAGQVSGPMPGWVLRGLASGFTGIALGLAVAFTIAFLLWLELGWIVALERRGKDLTMQTAVALHSPIVERLPPAIAARISPITFIDIDEQGCERLAERPPLCRTRGIAQASVLAPLGAALARSGASALVLDVTWPEEAESPGDPASRAMLEGWAAGTGPPVFAALPGYPEPAGAFRAEWNRIAGQRLGRLHFHPSATWFGPKDDPITRSFPATVDIADSEKGTRPRRLPSLAAAAAQGPSLGAETANRPILFTLPALSAGEEDPAHGLSFGTWERRALGRMINSPPGRSPEILVEGLEGQIVIVGSSAPAAADLRATPLGVMTGAEILANAIRAQEILPADSPPAGREALAAKVAGILPSMAIAMVTALAVAWLRRNPPRSRRRAVSRNLLVALVYSTGLAASVVATLTLALDGYLQSARQGLGTDLLLPTLAIFLEGFVGFAKWLIETIEGAIVRILTQLNGRWSRS